MQSKMNSDDLIGQARHNLGTYVAQPIHSQRIATAAVLILLYEKDGKAHVLFTKRTDKVERHKGEMSFPGGVSESKDRDLIATALRETFEEVGVQPEDVEIIGQLDEIITISDFKVTPYVGVLTMGEGYRFIPHEQEVAAIVEVPLRHLLDDRYKEMELRQWQGKATLLPAYTYDEYRIWGATGKMLQQFLSILS